MIEDILKSRFGEVAEAYMIALVYHAPEQLLDSYRTRLNELVAVANCAGHKALERDLWYAFVEVISLG